jgi:hypothetical protein
MRPLLFVLSLSLSLSLSPSLNWIPIIASPCLRVSDTRSKQIIRFRSIAERISAIASATRERDRDRSDLPCAGCSVEHSPSYPVPLHPVEVTAPSSDRMPRHSRSILARARRKSPFALRIIPTSLQTGFLPLDLYTCACAPLMHRPRPFEPSSDRYEDLQKMAARCSIDAANGPTGRTRVVPLNARRRSSAAERNCRARLRRNDAPAQITRGTFLRTKDASLAISRPRKGRDEKWEEVMTSLVVDVCSARGFPADFIHLAGTPSSASPLFGGETRDEKCLISRDDSSMTPQDATVRASVESESPLRSFKRAMGGG